MNFIIFCFFSCFIVNFLLISSTWALIQSRHCQCRIRSTARIIGGSPIAANQFPWQVSLAQTLPNEVTGEETIIQSHFCGGVLLNEYWVLTAAHCVYQKTEQPELISVGYAGDSDLVQMYFQSQTPVAEVHVHPDHVRIQNTSLHDLALLKLNYPIQFNDKVSPACLNPSMARAYSCEQTVPLVATGYGVQSIPETENAGMNSRRAKRLDMMDKSKIAYSCIQRPELLCAVSLTGSTCFGDSGSPLHHIKQGRITVIGISSSYASKGKPCDWYCTFVRISEYMNWINSLIGNQYCSILN